MTKCKTLKASNKLKFIKIGLQEAEIALKTDKILIICNIMKDFIRSQY